MKKLLLSSMIFLTTIATFAQNTGYEDIKQKHNLFIVVFVLFFIFCICFSIICVFLYRKGRSNRRRLHDLRLDMKELKEDNESTKAIIRNLEQKIQEYFPNTIDAKANIQPVLTNIPIKTDCINPIHQRVKSKKTIMHDANTKYASSVNLIDNSFFSVTDIPTETSIFVLNIDKDNTQKANFRILEGALDKVKQVDDFLNQACNILSNNLSDPWIEIFVQKEGQCAFIDNKWQVVEKLDVFLK